MTTRSDGNDSDVVRIDLTLEQKAQVKQQTGKDADAVEFTVEELEQRIAPGMIWTEGYDNCDA
jgi:hypothetical protein